MTVTFRCGHSLTLPQTVTVAPSCGTCGEVVVSRVREATPRFVGTVRGPYAEFQPLAAVPVDLRVKESSDG